MIEDTQSELTVEKGDKGCVRILLPANSDICNVRADFIGYPYDTTTVVISLLSTLGLIVIIYNNSRKMSEERNDIIAV